MNHGSNLNRPDCSARKTPVSFSGPYQFQIIDQNHSLREKAESFIAIRFAQVHGAQITSYMPNILALLDVKGSIRASIGVRAASHNPLFLEHYFDSPIEEIILNHAYARDLPIHRQQVVEVGNLASVDRFASRRLFEMLALFLIEKRFQWIVFTGCISLRRLFNRMQLELVELGQADESRIPTAFGSWGQYYHDNPQVMLGHLSGAIALAERGWRFDARRLPVI